MVFALCLVTLLGAVDQAAAPLYSTSVVGTDFDFILESDRSVFDTLKFNEKSLCEMPDKTEEKELFQMAYQFTGGFRDGIEVHFAVHASVGTEVDAKRFVEKAGVRLGRIPHVLRRGVERVVINVGDATAFSDRGLIVLYTKNMDQRISTNDLEETMFHESVHATWDGEHAASAGWVSAQKSDPGFITNYAQRLPKGEDLAESALFAVTLIHHPDRLPKEVGTRVRAQIPARIAYIEKLFPRGSDWHGPAGKL